MQRETIMIRPAILSDFITLSLILVLIFTLTSCGNNKSLDRVKSELAPSVSPPPVPFQNDVVFEDIDSADVMPVFPGGDEALLEYISNNIVYPHSASINGVQGRVLVKFVVEPDGSVNKLSILQGVSKDLDEEAMRLVRKLPKFEPGIKDGKRVAVNYVIPITFKLY